MPGGGKTGAGTTRCVRCSQDKGVPSGWISFWERTSHNDKTQEKITHCLMDHCLLPRAMAALLSCYLMITAAVEGQWWRHRLPRSLPWAWCASRHWGSWLRLSDWLYPGLCLSAQPTVFFQTWCSMNLQVVKRVHATLGSQLFKVTWIRCTNFSPKIGVV